MWENTCALSKTYFISIDRNRTYFLNPDDMNTLNLVDCYFDLKSKLE